MPTISFRYNKIDATQIAPEYVSWQLVPYGQVIFPAKKHTTEIYVDATFLQGIKPSGNFDLYEPKSSDEYNPQEDLKLKGGEFGKLND